MTKPDTPPNATPPRARTGSTSTGAATDVRSHPAYKKPAVLAWAVILTLGLLLALYLLRAAA